MKKLILGLLVCGALLRVQAEDATWLTDLPAAQAQAKAEKKLVLLDFTGSDWCPWCIKFDKEALSTAKFSDYAKAHLALVLVDFPNKKPQSDALKAANKALAKKYKVDGYPTYVVLDADGKEIGRQVGYAEGGSDAFIKKIESFKK
jgi:protein disulfide-isomerase